MKHRLIVLLALGSASACAWLVSACGGSDNTNIDGGNDATTNDVATNDTGTNDTGTTDTGANKDGGLPDAACNKGPGCQQCCAALYPDAAAFFVTTEAQCACTTPGDCKTPCGNTLCQGKQASFACDNCLANKDAGDCRAAAVAACLNDTQCAQLAACVANCGPAPADAGGGG